MSIVQRYCQQSLQKFRYVLTNTLVVDQFGELCYDKQEADDAEVLHNSSGYIDLSGQ